MGEFFARLSVRRDAGPIDSVESVAEFVSTRASFVAQKTLYGYLKTRMGTRYPSLFEDDVFVRSIDIAKFEIFAACLSDLSIFASARSLPRACDATLQCALARKFFQGGIGDNADMAPEEFSAAKAISRFEERLAGTDWGGPAGERGNFTESPKALFDWAPIAPQLKQQDADIVRNSINFAWSEVRQTFERRLDARAIETEIDLPVP